MGALPFFYLYRLEIKTNRNKEWSKSTIRYLLTNKRNVENNIIDIECFNCTVKLLNDNKKIDMC